VGGPDAPKADGIGGEQILAGACFCPASGRTLDLNRAVLVGEEAYEGGGFRLSECELVGATGTGAGPGPHLPWSLGGGPGVRHLAFNFRAVYWATIPRAPVFCLAYRLWPGELLLVKVSHRGGKKRGLLCSGIDRGGGVLAAYAFTGGRGKQLKGDTRRIF